MDKDTYKHMFLRFLKKNHLMKSYLEALEISSKCKGINYFEHCNRDNLQWNNIDNAINYTLLKPNQNIIDNTLVWFHANKALLWRTDDWYAYYQKLQSIILRMKKNG